MTRAAAAVDGSSGLRDLVALTKPRITAMVVLTMAGGLALSPERARPSWADALLALGATALIVGSASVLNGWIERRSDRSMTRTMRRPLAAGRVSTRAALILAGFLVVAGVPLLLWATNPLTCLLGLAAFVSYVAIYTPLKRRSWTALLVGAVPGALPPLMGWTAATEEISAPGIALFAILYVWQLPHFAAIALRRENEYASAGIRVLPLVHGRRWTIRFSVATTALLIPTTLSLFVLGVAGELYVISASVLGAMFALSALVGARASITRWARRLFVASLLYLPLLFAALAADRAMS